mgnify:FL=1
MRKTDILKLNMSLNNLTIKKTQELLKSKQISARDLVSYYFGKIEEKNKDINAYLEVFGDALGEAERLDKEGFGRKVLFGVPLAVKDNILIEGKTCSAGSKMLQNYRASYDATVIKKLKEAGVIFLGRTNMDEFAMGASTENSAFGATKNPFDLTRVSGGSSGGSASAVAMDGCLVALGSDTGGSIRQPASFCGVVGLNPTYGSVSRFGLIAMASSFDQIGPMTKTVEDAEIIFNIIKGKDAMDSTSSLTPDFDDKKFLKLKVGVLKYDKSGVDKEVNESLEKSVKILKDMGYEVSEIDLPNIKYSVSCYYILVPAEVSSNLARFDGVRYGLFKEGKSLTEDYMETREAGFGLEVRRRIILGTYVLSAGYYDDYYTKAQKVRELIRMDFDKAFDLAGGGVDVIISPVSPSTAFKIGEKTNDPLKMYLEDIFTAPAKMAGLPAISIPNGFDSKGLPIGLQITAPRFGEKLLFEVGKKYESNL